MQIEGTSALVTGANRGLGKALVNALLDRGARTVYAAARHPDDATGDPRVVPVRLDITDPDQVAAAAAGCPDTAVLVNNAALARRVPAIAAPSLDDAREQMDTNYLGTLRMCRAFAPVLAANGGGALVNMLSIVSFFASPGMGTFCPTKAALWSLTHALRMELRAQRTLVTGVHVGFIDTRLAAGVDLPRHPPAEVAAAILDGVQAGEEELLLDERTRAMKQALPRDLELIYPEVEKQWTDRR